MSDIQMIPFPCFVTDEQERLVHFNTLFQETLGDLINGQDWINKEISVKKVTDDSKVIRVKSTNGSAYIFLYEESYEGEGFLYVGTKSTAVSGLLKRLKEAEQLNRELDTIIENTYDGIYITDANGVTLKANQAIERITGIPASYYFGKSVDALVDRGILKKSVTHMVREQKRVVSIVQKNFEDKETLFTGMPVFDEKGRLEKVVTNIRGLSELNELQQALSRANELNRTYKNELEQLKGNHSDQNLIVASEQMKMIYHMAERIANVDATVLILGETGVGKDVLAKYIFNKSVRSQEGKFIKINCGAIPPELLESELFGYEKGAFTGASTRGKPGLFELADKGMLFLDEIGELSLALQVKLLRALQEGEIQRIGGTKTKKINVRVMAATNRHLEQMVEQGEFREDLYYRLNVIPIQIPPLRERSDDILLLANMFLRQLNEKYGLTKKLDQPLRNFLMQYQWKGNVRELSNLMERMVLTVEEPIMGIQQLPVEYRRIETQNKRLSQSFSLKGAIERAEEQVIQQAAKKYESTYEIAKALETSQPTIVRKLKKYNISIKS